MQQQFEKEIETSPQISVAPALPQVVRGQSDPAKEKEFQGIVSEMTLFDILTLFPQIYEFKITKKLWMTPIVFFLIFYGFHDKHIKNLFPIFLWLIFLVLVMIYLLVPAISFIGRYDFVKKAMLLIPYNDMRSVGILCRSAHFSTDRQQQDKVFSALQHLLENLKKEDISCFRESHEVALQDLLKHKRIRKEFPELMQAIIVALYTLHTKENKLALEKLAKEKPKREEERWISQAAQSCLDAWGNNNAI
jgi:hypothetical protein